MIRKMKNHTSIIKRLSFYPATVVFFTISSSFGQEIQSKVVNSHIYTHWELICASAKPSSEASIPSSSHNVPFSPAAEGDPFGDATRQRAGDPARQSGNGAQASVQSCKMTHRLTVKGSSDVVFLVTILPGTRAGQFVGIFSAPLGGYLTPGMEMRIDNKNPYKILFETCNSQGCHGGFELSKQILAQFNKGKDIKIRLWTGKNNSVDLKIDLDGFSHAFSALREKS